MKVTKINYKKKFLAIIFSCKLEQYIPYFGDIPVYFIDDTHVNIDEDIYIYTLFYKNSNISALSIESKEECPIYENENSIIPVDDNFFLNKDRIMGYNCEIGYSGIVLCVDPDDDDTEIKLLNGDTIYRNNEYLNYFVDDNEGIYISSYLLNKLKKLIKDKNDLINIFGQTYEYKL